MASNVLSIDKLAVRDNSIIKKEIYQYTPYTTSFGESDEIRIAIQSKDAYLLPSESYIFMQIGVTTAGAQGANDDPEIQFINNFASFLFSDARYELNGVEIDRVRNVGRATTMKLSAAANSKHLNAYAEICKTFVKTTARNVTVNTERTFEVVIPLSAWFGFCDDYRKIIINCKHELILNRARQSLDCTQGGILRANTAVVSIALRKIEWKMPHITLSDPMRLSMLNYLSKSRKITIQHRSMDMIEYPTLPTTSSHIWSVKTVSQVNKPRYVIVGLQTNRDGVRVRDASHFDISNITQMRLHLNAQIYPYNMNDLDIGNGLCMELYSQYKAMQLSYYGAEAGLNPFNISLYNFQSSSPLFVFDTSRSDESLIDSPIDIRIEMKGRQNFNANTAAFCLIIYDSEFTYSPFEGIVVRKI